MKRGLIQLGEVWGQISEKYRKFKQIKKKPIISIREKLNVVLEKGVVTAYYTASSQCWQSDKNTDHRFNTIILGGWEKEKRMCVWLSVKYWDRTKLIFIMESQ